MSAIKKHFLYKFEIKTTKRQLKRKVITKQRNNLRRRMTSYTLYISISNTKMSKRINDQIVFSRNMSDCNVPIPPKEAPNSYDNMTEPMLVEARPTGYDIHRFQTVYLTPHLLQTQIPCVLKTNFHCQKLSVKRPTGIKITTNTEHPSTISQG
jgi:hypothetical protein